MRFALFLTFFAALLCAQDDKCRVEGQVLSILGAPLKKATVRLSAASEMNQSNFSNYSVQGDDEGKFLFEDVKPGTYVLSAERTGYLQQYYGARSTTAGATQIKLVAGQAMKDLVFKLTPQGMIYGTVVDQDGDPLPGAQIQAVRWAYVNGKKRLTESADQQSQADGSFIIGGLTTGRYFLSADVPQGPIPWVVEQAGNKKVKDTYLKTFFPNALDVGSASLVDVARGAEVRGIEIRVQRGRTFEISGKVESRLGKFNYIYVALTRNGETSPDLRRQGAQVNPATGVFLMNGITPGTYTIQTQGAEVETKDPTGEFTKATPLVGHAEVTVVDRNVDNVIVSLDTGVEIRGRIKREGEIPDLDKATLAVQFNDDSLTYGSSEEADKDGAFRMQAVSARAFRVAVTGLPGNAYVKAISFEGTELLDRQIDLSAGRGGAMEILLSPDGAEVTGIVHDADAKPVPGAVVQICDAENKSLDMRNADINGVFELKGLAPGVYKVFAWEDRGDGIISDADFRKSFESKAIVVKLSEKSRENIDAALIPKDAMDAEAVKIQ